MLPEFVDNFLKYDYGETKDLCKSFLTLVSALLVFSVTFSEKIVGFPRAKPAAKACLVLTWALFLIAIIACGIGLTLMALAAGAVLYDATPGYPQQAYTAYDWIILAGCSFVSGLVMLIVTAIISVYSKSKLDEAAS
jgi:hypothetical protein